MLSPKEISYISSRIDSVTDYHAFALQHAEEALDPDSGFLSEYHPEQRKLISQYADLTSSIIFLLDDVAENFALMPPDWMAEKNRMYGLLFDTASGIKQTFHNSFNL